MFRPRWRAGPISPTTRTSTTSISRSGLRRQTKSHSLPTRSADADAATKLRHFLTTLDLLHPRQTHPHHLQRSWDDKPHLGTQPESNHLLPIESRRGVGNLARDVTEVGGVRGQGSGVRSEFRIRKILLNTRVAVRTEGPPELKSREVHPSFMLRPLDRSPNRVEGTRCRRRGLTLIRFGIQNVKPRWAWMTSSAMS